MFLVRAPHPSTRSLLPLIAFKGAGPGHDKQTQKQKPGLWNLDHAIEPHNYLTLHIQQNIPF
jgi:hypothetical protein